MFGEKDADETLVGENEGGVSVSGVPIAEDDDVVVVVG